MLYEYHYTTFLIFFQWVDERRRNERMEGQTDVCYLIISKMMKMRAIVLIVLAGIVFLCSSVFTFSISLFLLLFSFSLAFSIFIHINNFILNIYYEPFYVLIKTMKFSFIFIIFFCFCYIFYYHANSF